MESGIYMWISQNGKSYIGQATDLNRRKSEFERFNKHYAGAKIECARRKYNNIQYWTYKILEYCDIDALDEREAYYINYYGTLDNGYNCESGGHENKILSEETKRKLSEINKGRHHTEETKCKLSKALKGKYCGENNPMFGKHHSEETKCKISINHANFKGERHPRARTVIQYTKDGQFVAEYSTLTEAALKNGFKSIGSLTQCCKGKLKTCGGYLWKYKKEND